MTFKIQSKTEKENCRKLIYIETELPRNLVNFTDRQVKLVENNVLFATWKITVFGLIWFSVNYG